MVRIFADHQVTSYLMSSSAIRSASRRATSSIRSQAVWSEGLAHVPLTIAGISQHRSAAVPGLLSAPLIVLWAFGTEVWVGGKRPQTLYLTPPSGDEGVQECFGRF